MKKNYVDIDTNESKDYLKIFLVIIIIIILLFSINFYFNKSTFSFCKFFCKKENLENLNYVVFEPSSNIAHNLGQIFKNGSMNFNHYPYVEIQPSKPLFSNNKFLPECCLYYNEYSSDRGCPCITPDQQYYLQRRGINRHNSSILNDESSYKNIYYSHNLALKGEEYPFNPLVDASYNVYITRANLDEFPSDVSVNEFYSKYVNNSSYETQNDGIDYSY